MSNNIQKPAYPKHKATKPRFATIQMLIKGPRKFFDSADYEMHGIAFKPYPNLLAHKTKPSLSKVKFIRGDRKFFDPAEWVLTGEVCAPHPNYGNTM